MGFLELFRKGRGNAEGISTGSDEEQWRSNNKETKVYLNKQVAKGRPYTASRNDYIISGASENDPDQKAGFNRLWGRVGSNPNRATKDRSVNDMLWEGDFNEAMRRAKATKDTELISATEEAIKIRRKENPI